MTRQYKKFDLEELKRLVAESSSFREVAIKRGAKPAGGNCTSISHLCKRHGLDISHMTGQVHNKGKPAKNKKTAEQVLVMGDPLSGRMAADRLRRALFEQEVPHKCNDCNIDEWNGRKLVLEIDHIDGQYWNNQRDNLQFLCPNCHSFKTHAETKARKEQNLPNVDAERELKPPKLKKQKEPKLRKPSVLAHLTKEQLEALVMQNSFVAVGQMFNISDNAVRRWCKKLGIEMPGQGGRTPKLNAPVANGNQVHLTD